ncbi:hypothetical protein [Elizabethkingia meningoseptica]|uniref:hypothetical protein n=1 Tax=Elizabethkingia meningoseptica TaxID=238 RepID=UPI0038924C24
MKNIKITTAVVLLSFSILATSCRSTDSAIDNTTEKDPLSNGSAVLKLDVLGTEFETNNEIIPTASSKNSIATLMKDQVRTVLVDDKILTATLSPVISSPLKTKAQLSVNPVAATSVDTNKLAEGVKFRVAVYKDESATSGAGTYIGQKLYTITGGVPVATTGTNSTTADMTLNGDTETTNKYTFVVYSYNNTSDPGSVSATTNLSAATINNISGDSDLMYYKVTQRVTAGNNNLNIILQHKFSQITTIIDASAVSPGNGIQSINTPSMNNHRLTGNSIQLSNGVVTFSSGGVSKGVSFAGNSNTSSTWTSVPLLIANPGASASDMTTLSISSMQVGTKTKSSISVPNVVIRPGIKYNLKLKFACTEDATPTWPFNMSDSGNTGNTVLTRTFNAPAADAGFVFDVYQLDNSFNMKINGVDLATQEIQFQSGVDGYPRNIRFKSDGAQWGASGIPQIYSLGNSTNSTPIIRITIGPDGSVSMMGRRTIASNLEPLELYGGTQFNKITWKTTGSNEVISTMLVTGETIMRGLGVGKKIKPCS